MANILVGSDGTGNKFGENNTNVVMAYEIALKNERQRVYYDPGVGTGGWRYDEGKGELTALSAQATGAGIQANIDQAYTYLMNTYESGDRIFLFGFSRGAFTVRALAGMLHRVGLLRPHNENLLEYASDIYNDPRKHKYAGDFKAEFGRECPVYFIGVWDTVDSRALNEGRRFADAKLNPEVKYGYQALSIDEKRKDFPPLLWDESQKVAGQTIEQVWFAGVHSDVGGWYGERGLSNTALQWMMSKARRAGLLIDEVKLRAHPPDPHDKIHDSYKTFWRFRGRHVRSIEEGSNVHASVYERIDRASNKYEPRNLPHRSKVNVIGTS